MGFKKIYSDPSLYIYDDGTVRIIVPVWVDDITLASKSKEAFDKFVVELEKHFKLRDLGETSYLLGMEITRDWDNHKLSTSRSVSTLSTSLHSLICLIANQWGLPWLQV